MSRKLSKIFCTNVFLYSLLLAVAISSIAGHEQAVVVEKPKDTEHETNDEAQEIAEEPLLLSNQPETTDHSDGVNVPTSEQNNGKYISNSKEDEFKTMDTESKVSDEEVGDDQRDHTRDYDENALNLAEDLELPSKKSIEEESLQDARGDDDVEESLSDSIQNEVVQTQENKEASSTEYTEEELREMEGKMQLEDMYQEGMKLINSSNIQRSILKGYKLLQEAASSGHPDAEVEIGFAHLAGAYLKQQLDTARSIFIKHAGNGNPRAQAGLGFLYASGIATNSSQAKALVYLTFSALGEDTMGRMMLGYRYLSGIGVSKSCETALNYYRKVGEKVAAQAKLTGGSLLMRIRLLDEANRPGGSYGVADDDLIQYYQFLADKGDAPAQVTLGQLNYQGSQGFEQNHQKAFEYFSKAAEAGNANAQGYLGKIYAEGSDTIKQNNNTALKFFKQAAAQGNSIGQAGLGLMYLYGKGVPVDYDKAFKYFQSSADQGWAEGQLNLGNMYFHGQSVKRDYKQAIRLFNLAAQNGHLLALYYLAKMHATGTGVMRSCHTAVELYKNVCERGRWSSQFELAYNQYQGGKVDSSLAIYLLLAELGYEVAQSNVAYILDSEQSRLLPNQTFARALVHWDRAADQGYSIARIKLGDYYYYGRGTEVDYEIAASHYKVASEQNSNAQAMFNLGYMHEQGLGMKRDIHLAKRQYDMAAEASADAFAPVTLALIKLGFLFAWEHLQSERWPHHSYITQLSSYLSDDWDLYLITLLALMLAFVVAYRRQMR